MQLAKWWKDTFGKDTVTQVTFHPSYCYEDFIEGFKPTKKEGFQLRDGIFKSVCKKAKSDPKNKYLLIIDEINRGDVARIMGELITLLEKDKRGETYTAILQQSGDEFYVPENLYVLGTMNTADKSISLMDLAIRRRFLFYAFAPNLDILNQGKAFYDEIEGLRLSQFLAGINDRLMGVGIDRDKIIGHSYLLILKDSKDPIEILKNRIQYEIFPLLEEYCYADRSLMQRVLGNMVDDSGTLDQHVVDDSKRFIEILRGLSKSE